MIRDAGMNTEMGTKWFTFYTKVRPWFAGVFFIPSLVNLFNSLDLYLSFPGLLLSFIASAVYVVLIVVCARKSEKHYAEFLHYVSRFLMFETVYMAYQAGVQHYFTMITVLDEHNIAGAITVGLCTFVFGYFVWYRLNIKYFRKRLIQLSTTCPPHDNSISTLGSGFQTINKLEADMSPSNIDEKPQPHGYGQIWGSDVALEKDLEAPLAKEYVETVVSDTNSTSLTPAETTIAKPRRAAKYCSKCGNAIDAETKKMHRLW